MSTTVYTNNGQVLIDVSDNKWLAESSGPTPIVLPDNTIRIRFASGYTPNIGNTNTLVDSTNNIWDIYKSSNSWDELFMNNSSVIEVIAFNNANIISIYALFFNCTNLINVPLLDTTSLTQYVSYAFYGCTKVESGALALYQRLSVIPYLSGSASHEYCFYNCGSGTQTGAAELAQIPSSWK
jgi:hypothetical protein